MTTTLRPKDGHDPAVLAREPDRGTSRPWTLEVRTAGSEDAQRLACGAGEALPRTPRQQLRREPHRVALRDAQSHVYKFGTYSLPAYKSVTIHTGKGTDGAVARYWGMGDHVWNNGGDTATVRNAAGAGMDSCRWTTAGSGYINC